MSLASTELYPSRSGSLRNANLGHASASTSMLFSNNPPRYQQAPYPSSARSTVSTEIYPPRYNSQYYHNNDDGTPGRPTEYAAAAAASRYSRNLQYFEQRQAATASRFQSVQTHNIPTDRGPHPPMYPPMHMQHYAVLAHLKDEHPHDILDDKLRRFLGDGHPGSPAASLVPTELIPSQAGSVYERDGRRTNDALRPSQWQQQQQQQLQHHPRGARPHAFGSTTPMSIVSTELAPSHSGTRYNLPMGPPRGGVSTSAPTPARAPAPAPAPPVYGNVSEEMLHEVYMQCVDALELSTDAVCGKAEPTYGDILRLVALKLEKQVARHVFAGAVLLAVVEYLVVKRDLYVFASRVSREWFRIACFSMYHVALIFIVGEGYEWTPEQREFVRVNVQPAIAVSMANTLFKAYVKMPFF